MINSLGLLQKRICLLNKGEDFGFIILSGEVYSHTSNEAIGTAVALWQQKKQQYIDGKIPSEVGAKVLVAVYYYVGSPGVNYDYYFQVGMEWRFVLCKAVEEHPWECI